MSRKKYNSGRDTFIGWGIPARGDLANTVGPPENFTGALVYYQEEEQLYYSTGTDWKSPENPPIKRPYALEPTSPVEQAQLRLSTFLSGQGFKYEQVNVLFEAYLDENMQTQIDLSPGYPPEDSNTIKNRLYSVENPKYQETDYVFEPNADYIVYNANNDPIIHTRNLFQFDKTILNPVTWQPFEPGTAIYWRGKYGGRDANSDVVVSTQESLFSQLFKQNLPDAISRPTSLIDSNVVTDKLLITPFDSPYDYSYNQTIWYFGTTIDANNDIINPTEFVYSPEGETDPINRTIIDVLNGPNGDSSFKDGNTYYWQAAYKGIKDDSILISKKSPAFKYIQPSANIEFLVNVSNLPGGVLNVRMGRTNTEIGGVYTTTFINWGDESTNEYATIPGENWTVSGPWQIKSHAYSISGNCKVKIYGLNKPYSFYLTDNPGLLEVNFLGKSPNSNLDRFSFANCQNLIKITDYIPPTVSRLDNCFKSCTKFNQSLKYWDISQVRTFTSMFENATNFNGDISLWALRQLPGEPEYPYLMNNMFKNAKAFNSDISGWDTGYCTSMAGMFYGTNAFNRNLSNWKTGNVVDMSQMFAFASAFDSDISGWDTSLVTSMSQMFYGAFAFNRDINYVKSDTVGVSDKWDVSKCTNFSEMFAFTEKFNGDIGKWQFSNSSTVSINMSGMFKSAKKFNRDISFKEENGILSWDTSRVTNMSSMFNSCVAFNSDISNWKTGNVVSMSRMFQATSAFNKDLKTWDFSKVQDLSYMLADTISFRGDLNGINVSNCTNFSYMFNNSNLYNGNVSGWILSTDNTKNINMTGIFQNCFEFNSDISNWNVIRVTNLTSAFYRAYKFNQNIGLWGANTRNITSLSSTFYCPPASGNFVSRFNQPLNSWDVSNVTSLSLTFYGCANFNQPLNSWNTSKVISLNGTFMYCYSFNNNITNWDTSQVEDMSYTFFSATQFSANTLAQNIDNWNVSKVKNLFRTFTGARNFKGSLSSWNTSNVTTMYETFNGCRNFNGNISGWPISSKLQNLEGTFSGATLFNRDLHTWNTSNVTTLSRTFIGASSFNGNIDSWNTSNVYTMYATFYGATAFNRDIKNWDTKNVQTMSYMFLAAPNFNRNISGWDVSNVTDMSFMFYNALQFGNNTTGIWGSDTINNWNVSNVLDMAYMFYNTKNFDQNLAGWGGKVSKVGNMNGMFENSVFNQSLGNWNIRSVFNITNMIKRSKLSTTNYDNTLNGWWGLQQSLSSSSLSLRRGLVIDAAGLTRSFISETAVAGLTQTTGLRWRILNDVIQ